MNTSRHRLFRVTNFEIVGDQVTLVDYAGCLEWPTGADFDPETLHDWPLCEDEIIERRKIQANL